jgi:DNA ligase-1
MNILETTKNFCDDMNKTNSTLDKKVVLKKYPEMKGLLEWVYNPFKQFYVTSDNCKKHSERVDSVVYNSIFDLLSDLTSRKKTGYLAIALINKFIDSNVQYKEVIYNIIDKDLKCRIGDKIINDVYLGLIPTFDVALAGKIQDYKGNVFDGTFYVSRKLDGVRVVTIIDENGNAKFLSRQGKEFETLGVLRTDIELLNLKNKVFDGEVCLCDRNGTENFQDIMKLIRKKDFYIENPTYLIFDYLTTDEFFKGKSSNIFEKRYNDLCNVINGYTGDILKVLKQEKLTSQEQFDVMVDEVKLNSWEGLILRKNVPYKSGRSKDMLKVKEMLDDEYMVNAIEVGPFRTIENGKEVTIETLASVKIIHKGNEVSVGSGFTINQRKEFYADPTKIVGHKIIVKYFEETQDKNGKFSLRFPIFKGIRDIKE